MTTVPLGVHAYKRTYGGEPEIKLVNRFIEAAPINEPSKAILQSRPGTTLLNTFAGGVSTDVPRGLYSLPGLFNNDLFVVVGSKLWRYSEAGVKTSIAATLGGTGRPYLTWDKGLTYQRLFISDGQLLWYYDGGTKATGKLTATVNPTTQVVQIGTIFYSWNISVDTGPPDGSSAKPFLANPGSDPMTAMANMLDFIGVPGTNFSTVITAPNTQVTAVAVASPKATGVLTSSLPLTNQVFQIGTRYYSWNVAVNTGPPTGASGFPYLANPGTDPMAAMVKLLMNTGVAGTDYSSAIVAANPDVSVVASGGPPATILTATALVGGTAGNSIATTVFSGAGLAWGGATLIGGGVSSMTLTALVETTAGNSIVTAVTGAAGLTWGAGTLTGGGTHKLVSIPVPTGEAISALANLNHFIMCNVTSTFKIFYLRPGSVVMGALDYASKESNPDPIVDMLTVGDFVYVIGTGSTEVWYTTGQNANPLGPVLGRTMARGALAGTAVNIKDTVYLVGDDGVVYSFANVPVRISDNAIEERIRTQLRRERGLP